MQRPKKDYNECFVIGICGGSGAGKKTLANQLFTYYERKHPGQVNTLHLHGYFINRQAYRRNLSRAKESGHTDKAKKDVKYIFDLPENINVPGLNMDLAHLHLGGSFGVPVRDFDTGKITGCRAFKPTPIVIIEGIYLYYFKTLRNQVDYKIFLDTPPETRRQRRLEKDQWIDAEYYDHYIEPGYQKYIEPYRKYADTIVQGQSPLPLSDVAALGAEIDPKIDFQLELTQ